MKYAINVPARAIVITFSNGKKIDISLDSISESDKELTLFYGAKQKVADAAASALKVSAETGNDIEEQRYIMALAMVNRLYAGTAYDRQSDGMGRVSYLIQAVGILYGLEPDAAAEKVKGLTDEKQKALAASPKIVAEILRLKAEAAAKALAKAQAGIDESDDEEELPEL